MQVRLYEKGFLHAKCWLFYSDRPGQQILFDRFRPILAIVGSSNFTAPGLTTNRELNLAHKVLLDPAEVEDKHAAYAVRWLSDAKPSPNITIENRQLLKSEVGARAIIDLEEWYERQWQDSRNFKSELVELLDASKFGRKEDEYSESDLEEALIRRLTDFLLELGDDFAFLGRQRRLRIDDTWFRIDLIFFHRRLHGLVIIDLKVGKFSYADAGYEKPDVMKRAA